MHTYQFIVPNEAITFQTDNDRIAMASCLIIGQGQAGALRIDEVSGIEIKIPSLTVFDKDASKLIDDYLGTNLGDFLESNELKIAECLESFAYSTLENRKDFDKKKSKFIDMRARNEFLMKHEKKMRQSVAAWVSTAWSYSRAILNKNIMQGVSKN